MLQVVLADDEKTIREGMANLIQSYHLPLQIVGLAQDGQQALEYVRDYRPEILIIDINMPYLNGLQTIEIVKKENPEMKIIIVSGYDSFNYAQKALELGVFSYLLKPLNFTDFNAALNAAVESYEKRLIEINLLNQNIQETVMAKKDDIKDYIKEHYAQPDLSLNQIANHFQVSPSTMAKIVKQRTSMNFSDYLNQLRIEAAINLLLTSELNINEISKMVGYSSQHYFSRIFKKYKGEAPLAYRHKLELKDEAYYES